VVIPSIRLGDWEAKADKPRQTRRRSNRIFLTRKAGLNGRESQRALNFPVMTIIPG